MPKSSAKNANWVPIWASELRFCGTGPTISPRPCRSPSSVRSWRRKARSNVNS
jgi:hypothetical protein